MNAISPIDALGDRKWVIGTIKEPRKIYGLYKTEDEANRICNDLNLRYGHESIDMNTNEKTFVDVYQVMHVEE